MNDQPNNSTHPNASDKKQTQEQKTSATQRRRSRKKRVDNAIVLAAISAVVSVILAFLSFPPLVKWLDFKLNLVSTIAIESTLTPTPVISDTPNLLPTFTFTPILENTFITPTFTLTSAPIVPPAPITTKSNTETMTVVLHSNASQGRAPITISFNAKDSYTQFADGSIVICGNMSVCRYTWTVFRENKVISKPDEGAGVFGYNFGGKGTYLVTVYVCRGKTCSGSGAAVVIR